MAVFAARKPPVVSVSEKLMLAFLTRLLPPSRTVTVIVETLLVWFGELVVNPTVPGTACTDTLVAVVATKLTFRVAAGPGLPWPWAVMIAGPAEAFETIATPGVSPVPLTVPGPPVIVPRLAENVTCCPLCGAPPLVQWTLIGVDTPRGMSTKGAGVVNAKLAVLTLSVWVLETPAEVAVSTSESADCVAVTTAVIWPEASVIVDDGAMAFPAWEAKVIGEFEIGVPAESFRAKVSVVEAPNAMEVLPLMVIDVPVTPTVLVIDAPLEPAVMVIVRFDLLAPRLSLAMTCPFASVMPLPLMLLTKAEGSGAVENVTSLPETACWLPSSTTAVRSIVVVPADGSCGLLTSSCIVVPPTPTTPWFGGVVAHGTPGPAVHELTLVVSVQPASASKPATRRVATDDEPTILISINSSR